MCSIDSVLQSLNEIGLFLQACGVLVILLSQGAFVYRAKKHYGGVKKAFLDMAIARCGSSEEVRDMNNTEVKSLLGKFPLADWLWDDFWISSFGLFLTLVGIVVEMLQKAY